MTRAAENTVNAHVSRVRYSVAGAGAARAAIAVVMVVVLG
jgi:hypothetical protein